MKRIVIAAGLAASLAWTCAHAGGPTTAELIDAEAAKTLKSLTESDKQGANSGVLPPGQQVAPPMAPLPVSQDAESGKPKPRDGLFARFGIVPDLSGYLMWNGVVHQIWVGKKVRGYTVVAINSEGADLKPVRGPVKHFASLVDEGYPVGDDTGIPTQARTKPAGQQPGMPPSAPVMPMGMGQSMGCTVGAR
jgi:hypothetical protein